MQTIITPLYFVPVFYFILLEVKEKNTSHVSQACSLTDVDKAATNGVSPKLSKSSSAGTTPSSSHESSLSSIGSRLGLRNSSDKKKEKADIKKMKVQHCS